QVTLAVSRPVTHMRKPQANSLRPVVDWLDELDAAGIIVAGHVNSRAVVVVSQELRKSEAGILAGVRILGAELPSVRTVRLKLLRPGRLPESARHQRLQQGFRTGLATQIVGRDHEWKLHVGYRQIGMIADGDGPITRWVIVL